MSKCIPYNKIKPFLKDLSKNFEVYFPAKFDDKFFYTFDKNKIENFHWGIPQNSPKEIYLPFFEDIEFYKNNKIIPKKTNPKKITVLFGIHPSDIHALSILTKIHNDTYPDILFNEKRRNIYIIGMGDFQYQNDFLCDIFFERNGDIYDIFVKNKNSEFLFKNNKLLHDTPFSKQKNIPETDPIFESPIKLSSAIEGSYNSKIWDDLAEIDLGCGNCSYTCPLCYCFELNDNFCSGDNYDAKKTKRLCSCYENNFFEIHGKNYRPKLRDRIYNWYHHKFVRFPRENGYLGCVDCGRCVKFCPAKINFKNVLKSILDSYEK